MDLVAGDDREILLAIAVEDWAGLADQSRFPAHVSLGGGLDPTWLDLFSEAIRRVTGGDDPSDFIDARRELDGPGEATERTVERVDPGWVAAVARIHDRHVAAVAARWIELVEEELGELPSEEKPWIRQLTGDLVAFARAADQAPTVIFAWSL
jgi:transposase-like protein